MQNFTSANAYEEKNVKGAWRGWENHEKEKEKEGKLGASILGSSAV